MFSVDGRRRHTPIFIEMNIVFAEISKTLRERRRELGVSQADLARLSGLSLHGLSDIETGKGNPTMETLLKVLQVLGLQILLKPTAPREPTRTQ
jgi:y4mF family transcriptional regulator